MKISKCFICFFVILPAQGSISIVYNLRVAETSKRLDIESMFPRPSLGTGTLLGTFREKYNGTKHNCIGGLFTLVYAPESFFLRLDGAVGRVASNDLGVHFSRTQTDDLLFSGGYSPSLSDNMRLTFSGLLGFPTHQDTSLEYVQLGYGHYGLGAQIDGSFMYSSNRDNTLRCAARCIHFFPRGVAATVTAPLERFTYTIGNLADLFIAFHCKIAQHSIEAGYNPSFFFGAKICPNFDDAVEKSNYIRNSFYGIYKYRFLINKRTHMIAVALSYGFEPTPKVFGNKRIVTTWASWSVNF
jgi:hypothetical protein